MVHEKTFPLPLIFTHSRSSELHCGHIGRGNQRNFLHSAQRCINNSPPLHPSQNSCASKSGSGRGKLTVSAILVSFLLSTEIGTAILELHLVIVPGTPILRHYTNLPDCPNPTTLLRVGITYYVVLRGGNK